MSADDSYTIERADMTAGRSIWDSIRTIKLKDERQRTDAMVQRAKTAGTHRGASPIKATPAPKHRRSW